MFDIIIEQLHQDFQFNKSSDFIQVELVGVYSVKLVRAQMEGNTQAAESLDRMIRCHMKDLKTTKVAREGEEPKGPQKHSIRVGGGVDRQGFRDGRTERRPSGKSRKKVPITPRRAKKRTSKTQAVTEGPDE